VTRRLIALSETPHLKRVGAIAARVAKAAEKEEYGRGSAMNDEKPEAACFKGRLLNKHIL
jgi:hypothetical protein